MRLLLQSCCAPCSTVALERLIAAGHEPTVFFCNPNISPESEYEKRLSEQRKLLAKLSLTSPPLDLITPPYDHAAFLAAVRGLEAEPEGGERCRRCFALRMRETARTAAELGFTHITTTLTTGPRKRAADVNAAGEAAAREFGVTWLAEDFKKRDGYKRSIELSREHNLYRQTYCGCFFAARSQDEAVQ